MLYKFFCLLSTYFQFSRFYENGVRHDKHNFKRGRSMALEVKIAKNYWKIDLKLCQLNFSVGELPNYLQIFLNTSERKKFEKVLTFSCIMLKNGQTYF